MTHREAFAKLRTILVRLYPEETRARVVVGDAGLNEQNIAFSGAAVNTWNSILREAENSNKMEDLFSVALGDFGDNPELRNACEAYRSQSEGAAGVAGGSSAAPSGGVHAGGVVKILFLAANPADTTHLRLDEESRSIDQALRQSEFRNRFELEQAWAVRVADLQGLLLRHQPHIVHFSGHGEASAIVLEDDAGNSHPVSASALSTVFSLLKDNILCVVLNACYSAAQAQAIAEHIDCVVGMSTAIGDEAAISFAAAFYQALGYGRDVKTAFELGRAQISLENIPEEQTPQLLATKTDPSQVTVISQVDSRGQV